MNICIYGASSQELRQEFFDEAYALGQAIGAAGHGIVFGGGNNGLMGACARGVKDKGGRVIGVSPEYFNEPGILFAECDELILTEDMRSRKQIMEEKCDAFVVLPGGIGTFEELFEILTQLQLGRELRPMAMLNTLGYYDALVALLQNAADFGFMTQRSVGLFALCNTPREVLENCARRTERQGQWKLDYYRR